MAKKTTRPAAREVPPPQAQGPAAPQIDLLTMEEAIALLKTTRPTFYRWLRSGRLRGIKVG